jgi:hypothetical protein
MTKRKDREIFVGKNRFYLGKNDIIYITLKEDVNKEAILKMRGAFFKLLMIANEKCNVLAINKKTGTPSFFANKIFKEVSEGENIEKVAILNMDSGTRGISSFMSRFYKNENLNYFDSKEDALMWLKN